MEYDLQSTKEILHKTLIDARSRFVSGSIIVIDATIIQIREIARSPQTREFLLLLARGCSLGFAFLKATIKILRKYLPILIRLTASQIKVILVRWYGPIIVIDMYACID